MSDENHTYESHIDDGAVHHDEAEAIEKAKESQNKIPEPPKANETNVEGVGVSEMQDAREKHQFVQ